MVGDSLATASRGRRKAENQFLGQYKPIPVRTEPFLWRKGHLPAGNIPSLCVPAQLLFFVETGHLYPILKEKITGYSIDMHSLAAQCASSCVLSAREAVSSKRSALLPGADTPGGGHERDQINKKMSANDTCLKKMKEVVWRCESGRSWGRVPVLTRQYRKAFLKQWHVTLKPESQEGY